MALETLLGVELINGVRVVHHSHEKPAVRCSNTFIYVDHVENAARFKVQNGPIREVGVNGCQIDEIIALARIVLQELDTRFPCRENAQAILKLQEAEMWLRARAKERANRGVEGLNKI